MICAEFQDRLFDEECRAALLGRAAAPADVAEHATRCPACARQWAEALADAQRLSHLVVDPPPALRRSLYQAFRPRTGVWSLRIHKETLSWAIAGGALGASLGGALFVPPGLADWAGFCVGAGLGLAFVASSGVARTGLAHWAEARRAIARSIDRLAQAI